LSAAVPQRPVHKGKVGPINKPVGVD
jgi:hypothetical protein